MTFARADPSRVHLRAPPWYSRGMVPFLLFVAAMVLWPRWTLVVGVAPFFGALLGAGAWCVAMFGSGLSLPLSSLPLFVGGGAAGSVAVAVGTGWGRES